LAYVKPAQVTALTARRKRQLPDLGLTLFARRQALSSARCQTAPKMELGPRLVREHPVLAMLDLRDNRGYR